LTEIFLRLLESWGCLYKDYDEELGVQSKPPESADKIIAATAFSSNGIVFTMNVQDYPTPFFKEVGRALIEYEKKDRPVPLYVFFMEPQLEVFNLYNEKRKKGQTADLFESGEKSK